MNQTQELLAVLFELKARFPDMRFGQLICNLTSAAQGCNRCDMWYVEDAELLEAAKHLFEFNKDRPKSADYLTPPAPENSGDAHSG